jgi:hypothetical protein
MNNSKAKTRIMLDGMRGGSKIDSDIKLRSLEVEIIRDILIKCGAEQSTLELPLPITNSDSLLVEGKKSIMQLTLRRDQKNVKVYYLNLSGNPLNFFEDSNVYGWADAAWQIQKAFKYCITYAQKKARLHFPDRIKDAILNLDINLNSLEFATYTKPLIGISKLKLINSLDYMYRVSNSYDFEADTNKSLCKLLNISRNNIYDTTFSLSVLNESFQPEMYFMLYDKEAEMIKDGINSNLVPIDILDRLRLEVHLTHVWFQKYRIKTLKQMVAYVEKSGGWETFIKAQMTYAINRTCIHEMFRFPAETIIDGSYKTNDAIGELKTGLSLECYQAMLIARSQMNITNSEHMDKMAGRPEAYLAKLNTTYLPVALLNELSIAKTKL